MYQHFEVNEKDIVIASSGNSYGKVAVVRSQDLPLLMNTSVIRFKPLKGFDYDFLFVFLKSNYFKAQIDLLITGGAQPNFGPAHLKRINIIIPPTKSEQTAIATVLSDTDALIESLEKLIAKKKTIKQGTMQQLLTGKKRLPGFMVKDGYKQTEVGVIPEDWDVISFIEIVEKYIDYRGRTPKKLGMDWGGGDILALSANNVQMDKINSDKEAFLASLELYKKWMVQGECQKDDVLLTMEAPLGNVAQIPDNKKYILSQRVILIRPKSKLTKNYLAKLLAGTYFQVELLKNASGSTAQGIQRQKLDKIKIFFPRSIAEQTASATLLSDMDTEIDTLEQKRDKYSKIKQGMMQQLLTGKIRLV